MYINGFMVKRMRKERGIPIEDLASYLTIEVDELEKYESGQEVWYSEDLFTITILEEVFRDYDFILDGEHKDMLDDLEQTYGGQ